MLAGYPFGYFLISGKHHNHFLQEGVPSVFAFLDLFLWYLDLRRIRSKYHNLDIFVFYYRDQLMYRIIQPHQRQN